jgi:hypothetical protein
MPNVQKDVIRFEKGVTGQAGITKGSSLAVLRASLSARCC